MATNLEKIKAEIAEMSAEELAAFYMNADEMCDRINPDQTPCSYSCEACICNWLNSESEEK